MENMDIKHTTGCFCYSGYHVSDTPWKMSFTIPVFTIFLLWATKLDPFTTTDIGLMISLMCFLLGIGITKHGLSYYSQYFREKTKQFITLPTIVLPLLAGMVPKVIMKYTYQTWPPREFLTLCTILCVTGSAVFLIASNKIRERVENLHPGLST